MPLCDDLAYHHGLALPSFITLILPLVLAVQPPSAECKKVPLEKLDERKLQELYAHINNCIKSGKTDLQSFYEEIEARLPEAKEHNPGGADHRGRDEDARIERERKEEAARFEAYARGIALALGERVADPGPVAVDHERNIVNKGFGPANASASVVEGLSLVTDIAVKRAKQQGLGFLKTRLETAVCGITMPNDDVMQIFPATCELVVKISPDKLVGDPRVVQVALFQDLFNVLIPWMLDKHVLGPEPDPKNEDTDLRRLKSLARLAIRIAARTLSKRDFAITTDDARTILSVMIDAAGIDTRSRIQWGKARAIPYGLAAAALWNDGKTGTLPEIIRKLESTPIDKPADPKDAKKPPALTSDEFARALEIANLAVVAATAARNEGLPDGHERLSVAVDLVFECILEFIKVNVCDPKGGVCMPHVRGRQAHEIVHAAIDRDVQNAVSGAVRLLLGLNIKLTDAERAVATAKDALKSAEDALKSAADAAASASGKGWKADEIATAKATFKAAETALKAAEAELAKQVTAHLAYQRRAEKAAALIAAVAGYADTYAPQKSADAAKTEQQTADDLRKKRQAVLEGLIDATTVRDQRHGEWVFSLGIPVGFFGGVQMIRERVRDADGMPVLGADNQPKDRWSKPRAMYPQIELPLGFAAQKLVGHRYIRGSERPCTDHKLRLCESRMRFDGLHLFVSMIDLGQFLAFDDKGKLSRPRWDSFISPGAQIGWIFGRPQNSMIIGVEGRYAPTLFTGTSELTVSKDVDPGGALRFGLFVAYYISLFDFN